MLLPNEYICSVCGKNLDNTAFFRLQIRDEICNVGVRYDVETRKYTLDTFISSDSLKNAESIAASIRLLRVKNRTGGNFGNDSLPTEITISYVPVSARREVTLTRRFCPECDTPVPDYVGCANIFTICMAGIINSGKSEFMKAIYDDSQHPQVLKDKMVTYTNNEKYDSGGNFIYRTQATRKGEENLSYSFSSKKKPDTIIVFTDTPGEIWTDENKSAAETFPAHADAYILIMSPMELKGINDLVHSNRTLMDVWKKSENPEHTETGGESIYSQRTIKKLRSNMSVNMQSIARSRKDPGIPVAGVITKIDILNLLLSKSKESFEREYRRPDRTENSLRLLNGCLQIYNNGKYSTLLTDLTPMGRRETDVSNKYGITGYAEDNGNEISTVAAECFMKYLHSDEYSKLAEFDAKYFFSSSLRATESSLNSDDEREARFYNVHAPVMWILDKFGL